jgi:hypothetical protein
MSSEKNSKGNEFLCWTWKQISVSHRKMSFRVRHRSPYVCQLEGVKQIDMKTSFHVRHRGPCLCHLERISMDTEMSFRVVHRNPCLHHLERRRQRTT